MAFDIQNELIQKGFVLDFEKDERSSFLQGSLSVTLHWDGDMIDTDGYCISMTIQQLNQSSEGRIYFGRRPVSKGEFEMLFDFLNLN